MNRWVKSFSCVWIIHWLGLWCEKIELFLFSIDINLQLSDFLCAHHKWTKIGIGKKKPKKHTVGVIMFLDLYNLTWALHQCSYSVIFLISTYWEQDQYSLIKIQTARSQLLYKPTLMSQTNIFHICLFPLCRTEDHKKPYSVKRHVHHIFHN